MKKILKLLLTITCVVASITFVLILTLRHRDVLGEYYARSAINVEIDRRYITDIAIRVGKISDSNAYRLSPTTFPSGNLDTVVMHANTPLKRPFGNPAIQIPLEDADATLAAIDSVAFFVGNKLFYFSHDEVQQFSRVDNERFALFHIPGISYTRSGVFNRSNSYGDLNMGILALTAFFVYPARFAVVYLLLALLLFLYRKQVAAFCESAVRNREVTTTVIFILILAAGFVLRWNGYARHSGWTDEIYSAVHAGNPNLPFLSTFGDSGNPPFYFILLRFWFKVFGWSEEAGRMFSVLLGTISIASLYLLVKRFLGRKAGIFAALFVAFSGFSIGYSQEMRAYILLMALAPFISLAFFRFVGKASWHNLLLYIVPSMMIVNAHFYGILFVMANFGFYIAVMICQHKWQIRRVLLFFFGNIVIALSFLPYFLYSMLVAGNNFSRHFSPGIDHTVIFIAILVFIACFLVFRNDIAGKINESNIVTHRQILFIAYTILLPVFIYILAYIISFAKPMIDFRYLWPISAPFCFAIAAALIFCACKVEKGQFSAPLLVYACIASLHGIIPDIPGGGTEGYRQARAYIAADAESRPGKKIAMLENAPANAAYYGFANLPSFSQLPDAEIIYIYNDIFYMHEMTMYERLYEYGLDPSRILKIRFEGKYPGGDGNVVFKYFPVSR